jgi:hypothetical protein
MRRKLLSLLALSIFSLTAHAATAAPSTAVNWTWLAPVNPYPPCTTTVKVACNDYYVPADVTPGGAFTISDHIAVTATSYTEKLPAGNAYTTRQFTLTLMYKDVSGAEQTGPVATCGSSNTPPPCTVSSIIPNPPPNVTGLTGTPVSQ